MYSHVDSLNSLCGGWRSDLLHNKLDQKENHRRQALRHSVFISHFISKLRTVHNKTDANKICISRFCSEKEFYGFYFGFKFDKGL